MCENDKSDPGPRQKWARVHMTCELEPTIAIAFASIILKNIYLSFVKKKKQKKKNKKKTLYLSFSGPVKLVGEIYLKGKKKSY